MDGHRATGPRCPHGLNDGCSVCRSADLEQAIGNLDLRPKDAGGDWEEGDTLDAQRIEVLTNLYRVLDG